MGRYRLDPDRSVVHIEGRSSVHGIHTRTTGIEGDVELVLRDDDTVDCAAPHAGRIALAVDRLRSGNPFEERELRKRIDAAHHPTIDGELSSIVATDREHCYLLTGLVTFRGVTRECKDLMTIRPTDDGALSLAGESTFDIREFGMDPPRILALKVHPVVTVRVDLLAVLDA